MMEDRNVKAVYKQHSELTVIGQQTPECHQPSSCCRAKGASSERQPPRAGTEGHPFPCELGSEVKGGVRRLAELRTAGMWKGVTDALSVACFSALWT